MDIKLEELTTQFRNMSIKEYSQIVFVWVTRRTRQPRVVTNKHKCPRLLALLRMVSNSKVEAIKTTELNSELENVVYSTESEVVVGTLNKSNQTLFSKPPDTLLG